MYYVARMSIPYFIGSTKGEVYYHLIKSNSEEEAKAYIESIVKSDRMPRVKIIKRVDIDAMGCNDIIPIICIQNILSD